MLHSSAQPHLLPAAGVGWAQPGVLPPFVSPGLSMDNSPKLQPHPGQLFLQGLPDPFLGPVPCPCLILILAIPRLPLLPCTWAGQSCPTLE